MYRECRELSPRWWQQFTEFWNLSADFDFQDPLPEDPRSGQ